MIVDDSAPASPSGGLDEAPLQRVNSSDGITLADIPQLLEAEEARKQHRALPHRSPVPMVAELTPLDFMVIRHCALFWLIRSPIKSEIDVDELLDFIDAKKGGFWNKFFKGKQKQKCE